MRKTFLNRLCRAILCLGAKKDEPSLFEVTFLIHQVRYQYGFRASDDRFLEEWLYAWPSGKKQVWFERDNQAFKFGDNLKGENKSSSRSRDRMLCSCRLPCSTITHSLRQSSRGFGLLK